MIASGWFLIGFLKEKIFADHVEIVEQTGHFVHCMMQCV